MMAATDLRSVEQARRELLAGFSPSGTEECALADCLGRVLAEDVSSPHPLPPFNASSMDGYAVRAQDLLGATVEEPVTLEVVGEAAAGHLTSLNLRSGQAARVTTGSVIPAGADAVVPVEWTGDQRPQAGADLVNSVQVSRDPSPGAFIRPAGLDVEQGEIVLIKGNRLTVQDIGLLAATGRAKVVVYRRPRVAVFSTGDELRVPGDQLPRGSIFDANGPMIQAWLRESGAEPRWLGIVADTRSAVEEVLARALRHEPDLILSTAGVSMGSHDFVRAVVEERGVLEFWRVNMRPGKPLAFGSFAEIPFIGLPGNPVSSWMTFNVFVRPAIHRLSGQPEGEPLIVAAVLDHDIESDGRESYLRALITLDGGAYRADLTGNQDSAVLSSLVAANALVIVPQGATHLESGSEVQAWLFGENGLPAQIHKRSRI